MAKDVPSIGYNGIDFGADPELFIRELKTKKVIPADTFLPSKNRKFDCNGGKLFFDGVQAEMNINAHSCRDGFLADTRDTLKALNKLINKGHIRRKYGLLASASCRVEKNLIMKADAECRIFGCDPIRNAYSKKPTRIRLDGTKHLVRYAGGHIHLGFRKPSTKEADELTKVIDRVVGIPAVLLDSDSMTTRRKQYYGQAGEYRIQPHGYEYRTLSNFWLRAPMLTSLMLGLARIGYTIWNEGYSDRILKMEKDARVVDIINNTDTDEARKLYNKMRQSLVNVGGPFKFYDGLISFEYLSRMGLNRFFTKSMRDEWSLNAMNWSGSNNGWLNGMPSVLRGSNFSKFKTEFKKKNSQFF